MSLLAVFLSLPLLQIVNPIFRASVLRLFRRPGHRGKYWIQIDIYRTCQELKPIANPLSAMLE